MLGNFPVGSHHLVLGQTNQPYFLLKVHELSVYFMSRNGRFVLTKLDDFLIIPFLGRFQTEELVYTPCCHRLLLLSILIQDGQVQRCQIKEHLHSGCGQAPNNACHAQTGPNVTFFYRFLGSGQSKPITDIAKKMTTFPPLSHKYVEDMDTKFQSN